ncbi:GNAT family N-acetyltransferase [Sulfitobacter sp. JBTF-M27]|uniref:GNAT family N-acetyltransferase n=1 Tax=Sulfitobacter sediminilitoris TaxID=2698830 RepID=A0A6P0C6Z1_9RHOB|nr:GNAT family N-acetyltransferase [Sulfitobacter sediminilitoris]NEK20888.1 GNAT family N-acetyltransferase [Sulfitobacter sediminilitoris]
MNDIIINEAKTPAEIDAVRDLCWAYRDFLLNNSPVDQEITETFYPTAKYEDLMQDLPNLHARPKGIMLLAKDASGTPVGCGMTHALNDTTAEIKRVYVSETVRGQGVARQICTRLIDQARADGIANIVLDTSKSLTAAQALYDRLGFARRGPYQPIPEDVLPELLFFELTL